MDFLQSLPMFIENIFVDIPFPPFPALIYYHAYLGILTTSIPSKFCVHFSLYSYILLFNVRVNVCSLCTFVAVCFSPKTINFDCSILISCFLFVATTSFPHIKLQSTLSSLNSRSYMFHECYWEFWPKIYFTNSVVRNSLLTYEKGKAKFTLENSSQAQRSKCIILLSFNLGLKSVWVFNATPRSLYPRQRPGIHCIGGWLGRRTLLDGCGILPVFDPRTVQPVASGYTYYAIHARLQVHTRITTDSGYSHTAKNFFSDVMKRNVAKSITEIWRCIKYCKIKYPKQRRPTGT
jgi:hypothetical protein